MTASSFGELVAQHWVMISLALCPVLVVMMALAALSCEACGAPFGIFRRRQRTIDLCLRCAVLHDIRRANDQKKADVEARSAPSKSVTGNDSRANGQTGVSRLFVTQSPVELGTQAHPVAR